MTYDVRGILLGVATVEAIAIFIAAMLWSWFGGLRGRRFQRGLDDWRNRQKT